MLPHADSPILVEGATLPDAQVAIVLLHGRGASAGSILELGRALQVEGAALFAPQAENGSWYPYSFLAPLDANEPSLTGALSRVQGLVEAMEAGGLPRRHVAIIGFSQGACLALEVLARGASPVGATIALSGGLIGNRDLAGAVAPENKAFDYPGDLSGARVFLGCSDVDAHIPLTRVTRSASVLSALGADVETRIYPGMGHTVNPEELQVARDLVLAVARDRA